MRLSGRNNMERWRKLGISFSPATLALLAALNATPPARAQTYNVLHTFTGTPDGANPHASLIGDSSGNLYGTAFYGGAAGDGVVYTLDSAGNETVLYSFTGVKGGANPQAALLRDSSGNLYGTTVYGGAGGGCSCDGFLCGCGTVFKLDTAGTEAVVNTFDNSATAYEGEHPNSGLIWDPALGLCGATPIGGGFQGGIVYTLGATANSLNVLYSFHPATGKAINAGQIRDSAGNLYGTTTEGGEGGTSGPCKGQSGCGVVFKLDSAGNETDLYHFSGPDGEHPNAAVLLYSANILYGTTSDGGDSGYGVVFMLDIAAGTETILHSFTGGADGANPYASLIRDPAGNVYGTTVNGGASGKGVVFMVDASGKETTLYSFTGGTDGANPYAGLLRDSKGRLYGTTYGGGSTACSGGCGVVFRLIP